MTAKLAKFLCLIIAFSAFSHLAHAKYYKTQTDSSKDYTHTITTDTKYYMSGPQQSRPPEGTFKAGTKVSLIQTSGSYSLVKSEDGVQAYVSSSSIEKIEKE